MSFVTGGDQQTNGVSGEYELALIWPIERVALLRLQMRQIAAQVGISADTGTPRFPPFA